MLYGSPRSNRVLRKVARKCKITIAEDHLILGGKRFTGDGLVLITCYPNPYNPQLPVLLYTSADDRRVFNINSVIAGGTDYVVARWKNATEPIIIEQGDFTKPPDGPWSITE